VTSVKDVGRRPLAETNYLGASDRLPVVVLHVPGNELPALSVPLVRVTAVGTTTVAVPNLVFVRRTAFEGGEAALGAARLTVRRTQCAARFLIECCHR